MTYFEDVEVGMALPTLEKTPTTRQLVMYAGASGDFYPIHYDLEIARESGIPNVILHGALKNAFLGQLVMDWIGEAGTLKKLSVRYRGMDVHGKTLYCKGVVKRKYVEKGLHLVECDIWIENDDDEKNTQGSALVSLPSTGGLSP
jgi:acyl dehydratase